MCDTLWLFVFPTTNVEGFPNKWLVMLLFDQLSVGRFVGRVIEIWFVLFLIIWLSVL